MREENINSAKYTAFFISGHFKDFVIEDENDENLDRLSRDNFRACEKAIKEIWEKEGVKDDGYILFQDNIYKVYHTNGRSIKIIGPEAKEMKRIFKSYSKRTCEA